MKPISMLLLFTFLVGCSDGSRFDRLQCVDGNGNILLLKHNIGDTYFVDIPVEEITESKNLETNKKLYESLDN